MGARTVILSIYVGVEFCAFFFSVFGNLIVIYVVISSRELNRSSNKCLLNVAIADLLLGLFAVPSGVLKVRKILSKKGRKQFC